MKTKIFIIAAVAAIMLTSCSKTPVPVRDMQNEPLSITAITWTPETRTVYSGIERVTGSGSSATRYERIYWTAGDKFRVWSTGTYRDQTLGVQVPYYKTSGGDTWTDYQISEIKGGYKAYCTSDHPLLSSFADLPPVNTDSDTGNNTWNIENTNNTFYAMYPAPGSQGADPGISMNVNQIVCVLPEEQGGFATNPSLAMNYAYMYGYSVQHWTDPTRKNVGITFNANVTTFDIRLYGDPSKTFTVKSLHLNSATQALTGTYTTSISYETSATVGSAQADWSNDITVTFSPAVTLPSDPSTQDPLRLLLFAIPKAQTQLTLSLTVDEGGTEKTILQPLKKNGSWVSVPARDKMDIETTVTW